MAKIIHANLENQLLSLLSIEFICIKDNTQKFAIGLKDDRDGFK